MTRLYEFLRYPAGRDRRFEVQSLGRVGSLLVLLFFVSSTMVLAQAGPAVEGITKGDEKMLLMAVAGVLGGIVTLLGGIVALVRAWISRVEPNVKRHDEDRRHNTALRELIEDLREEFRRRDKRTNERLDEQERRIKATEEHLERQDGHLLHIAEQQDTTSENVSLLVKQQAELINAFGDLAKRAKQA